MLVVRDVRPHDLDDLLAVARHLDSVNLPAERALLAALIERSGRSFAGRLPVAAREYVFVLCDTEAGGRVVGTSMIHAQHGTPEAPHVWFEVGSEERCSTALGRRLSHQVLRIGYTFDGPTELGGLILLPEYRGGGRRAGKLLSYVRFLYIGAHRDAFRDQLLAELLPPFEADGTSLLWEHLGRRFTGLAYAEADRRSRDDKEFIRTLFPEGPIYACLLPPDAQAVIGQVGPATRGVEHMLLEAGFRHAGRIDPFDGGPHLMARTDDVAPVRSFASGAKTLSNR
ncbi:MAG TPA: arginine N-succinyltransferase [Nocardioides sp.]|nr:arginine N-succinyltransferase [Nocardioides sp.]